VQAEGSNFTKRRIQMSNVADGGERVEGADGLSIFFRSWRPEGRARALIVIVPGFNAHSGYYGWVAQQFVTMGLAVFAVDLRGRGNSDGERFYVKDFDDYVSDVASVIALAKSREPGLPLFLLGHSAGGVVSCLYTLQHQPEMAGLICESFAFQLPAPDFVLAVFKGISHLAPHAHILHLKNETFSRDPNVVQALNDDPLVGQETQPSQTMAAMVRADERVKQGFPLITLPVLILHGTLDKNAKPAGSELFYDMAGSADKTLKLYEGSFHDPLNDLDKEVVMADIKGWINARVPAALESPARAQAVSL
jgi:alpha-beta hydrolase superfamily lysophospholipase